MNNSDYNLTRENEFEIKIKGYEALALCVDEMQISADGSETILRVTFRDIGAINVIEAIKDMLKKDSLIINISTITPEGKTKSTVLDDNFQLEKYSAEFDIRSKDTLRWHTVFISI